MKKLIILSCLALLVFIFACEKENTPAPNNNNTDPYAAIRATFGTQIDPDNLLNYANQSIPTYILKDNSGSNTITNAGATLGRVLFYDKNLSVNNAVSCGSCHKQEFAFGDISLASDGVLGGTTARHSMRLINARFADEVRFFWDERATSLEDQTTKPIQDHAEMGFSGQNGRPALDSLLKKLSSIDYYNELFTFVYGDTIITEQRLQESLADFIRSIQSFDSKFDAGRALAPNNGAPFANFTAQENQGKTLFLQPPQFNAAGSRIGGGLGCQGCHRAPEFDIDPNTRNNGVIARLNNTAGAAELFITRAPSLRDVVNTSGALNGAMMHSGEFTTLQNTIQHYNNISIVAGNTNLDPRLTPGGNPQRLNITTAESDALIAFIRTLSGTNVYADVKWSDPF
jgi:cytochrome c peroxidase